MVLAWVQLDSKEKKVLACPCEEQVAFRALPWELFPSAPVHFSYLVSMATLA